MECVIDAPHHSHSAGTNPLDGVCRPRHCRRLSHWESGMLVRLLFVGILLFAESVYAACPSRTSTYVAGTVISPTQVMGNEDVLFEGLQDGLDTDCIADNAITTAKIAVGGVTSNDILDGTITTADLAFSITQGNILPAGAVFFMVTGNCPAWTSDVSTTYSQLFVRINATQGSLSGSNTHSHSVGTYVGSSHTHSVPATTSSSWTPVQGTSTFGGVIVYASVPNPLYGATTDPATGSSGSGAITGTSANGDNVPSFVTMKACQVS